MQHFDRTALSLQHIGQTAVDLRRLIEPTTRRARVWVEDTLDELRHNASTRWNMHRTRREHRMTPDTAKAIQRLEEKVEVES